MGLNHPPGLFEVAESREASKGSAGSGEGGQEPCRHISWCQEEPRYGCVVIPSARWRWGSLICDVSSHSSAAVGAVGQTPLPFNGAFGVQTSGGALK